MILRGQESMIRLGATILIELVFIFRASITRSTFLIVLICLLPINMLLFILFRFILFFYILYWLISFLIWRNSKPLDFFYIDFKPDVIFIDNLLSHNYSDHYIENFELYFKAHILLRAYLNSYKIIYNFLEQFSKNNIPSKEKLKNIVLTILFLWLNILFFYLIGFSKLVINYSLKHSYIISNFWCIIFPRVFKDSRWPFKAFNSALHTNILPISILPEFQKNYLILRIYKDEIGNIQFNPRIKDQKTYLITCTDYVNRFNTP